MKIKKDNSKLKGIFSKNLKVAREQAKFSQIYMSKKLGVAKSTYHNYEIGVCLPSAEVLVEIVKILDIPFEELFENN